VRYCSHSCISD